MDLYKITLNNGIPVEGSGDVATINALMADGGLATIGNLTDPAISLTDATPVSGISIWKQISKTLQAMIAKWPAALGAGGGIKVDGSGIPLAVSMAAVPPHNVTNAGIFAVQVTTSARSASASFSSDAAPLAIGDVIGAGGGAAALIFEQLAPESGELEIVSAILQIDRAPIAHEANYRLHLYSSPPPSALAGRAQWSLPADDRASYLGFIDFDDRVDTGAMQWFEKNNIRKQITTLSGEIYGYLVTLGAYKATQSPYRVTLKSRSA